MDNSSNDLFGTNEKITGSYDRALAVTCRKGTYVGIREKSGMLSFKGVRYAQPPLGELRWCEPQELPDSDDVYEAKYYGTGGQQPDDKLFSIPHSEDCLTLNIWTDPNTLDDKKPVMVWIHGGGYVIESATDPLYRGSNFAAAHHDVVLVSIEYRVNVAGFLQLEEFAGEKYKNANCLGLLDQIAALKWIKQNIAAFGGEKDNVTLFGESAGGGSISLLSISPLAKGLFQRAIVQSGSTAMAFHRDRMREISNAWLEKQGCKNMDDLLALPTEALKANISLAPVYPSQVLPYDSLEEMYEQWRSGLGRDIDLLIGCNKDEMSYFVWEFGGPEAFYRHEMTLHYKRRDYISDEYKHIYDELMIPQEGKSKLDAVLRTTNAIKFHSHAFVQAEYHGSSTGTGRNYFYFYTTPSHVDPAELNGFSLGACHSVEVSYVLNNLDDIVVAGPDQDQDFADTIQEMWVNFAKTGNPSTAEFAWQEFTKENWNVMILDDGGLGGIRIDNKCMRAEMDLIRPLAMFRCIEAGL